MDWKTLDQEIDELERRIPNVQQVQWLRIKESWGAVWDQCKTIQDGFKDVHYPAGSDRQAAWTRFQALRLDASEKRRWEAEAFERKSEPYKNDILEIVRFIVTNENRIFRHEPMTKDELQDWNRTMVHARERFKELREYMIPAHIQECREDIDRAQIVVNNWWEEWKALSQERYEAKIQRQQAWEERERDRKERHEERRQKIQANIDKNRGIITDKYSQVRHERARLSDLHDKLSETTSDKWVSIFSDWIAESERKIDSIEEYILVVEGWISEGEAQLRSM